MQTFPPTFSFANRAPETAPKFILPVFFETDSPYFTSHPDIPNVPGVPIQDVVQSASALSQRIVPDEGRSEIGAMSFSVIDKDQTVTLALRAKQTAGQGLRGKTAQLYMGYSTADFAQYQLFQTQVISGVAVDRGVYQFSCSDITREQKKDIFEPKRTTLAASLDASATTIQVTNTDAFLPVVHNDAWSDGPSLECGYIRIHDEVIRWEGKTSTTFTGCTRAVLNTRAVAHTVDVTTQNVDSRTSVTEVIYLEMPVPKLALAVLTGKIYGTDDVLPAHWHLGINGLQWIRESDFTGIGADLWDPLEDSQSFVARFANLKKTDGKAFLEKEVYLLAGLYPIVYSDGRLGLKRMNQVLADAPYVMELNEDNVMAAGPLRFNMDRMANSFIVNWNSQDIGNGEEFTRTTVFVDADSIALHGRTAAKTLNFRGLFGGRHTDSTVRARINALRDRFSHPPATLELELASYLNVLEVGDIVRVKLRSVRDYAGAETSINRSFEIQQKSTDYRTGKVSVELFGSTGRAGESPTTPGQGGEGPDQENSLPDSWYDQACTELSTVVDITPVGDVGTIDAGIWTLTGGEDMNACPAIYYYLGDLELPNGVTLLLEQNVQLRVRGFFQVNGTISGVGGGLPGVEDTDAYGTSANGNVGYLGGTRGMDGVLVTTSRGGPLFSTLTARATAGKLSAVPPFDLSIVPGSPPTLLGIPADMRGTGGGPGGKYSAPQNRLVFAEGGTGAAGGAALCIVCRGMAVGLSGLIDLSGDDSDTPDNASPIRYTHIKPGAGGAGGPGGLLILLDGSQLSVPDLGGRFVASTGHVGAPLVNMLKTVQGGSYNAFLLGSQTVSQPGEGYETNPPSQMITDVDFSNSAYRIQYVPAYQTPEEDQPVGSAAPTGLTATGVANGILLDMVLPTFDQFDLVQIYASTTNVRGAATLVAEVKATTYLHTLAPAETRYYWIRTGKIGTQGTQYSEWFPESDTAGETATSV